MSAITDNYINALLADGAYVSGLFDGMTSGQLLNALSPRMTPTLAKFISDNFEVVAHKESDDVTGSGFDATVWRGRANTTYAGKVYVSMQGTTGAQDFLSDVNLALPLGAARKQLVDMVNWWNQITTPTNGSASQIQQTPAFDLFGLSQFFIPAAAVAGTGLLTGVSSVQVNGHSLGGHLEAMGSGLAIQHLVNFWLTGFYPARPIENQ